MPLNKRIKIYSVDTNSFLSNEENELLVKIKGMENVIQRLKEFTLLNTIEKIYKGTIAFTNENNEIKAYMNGKEIEDAHKAHLLYKIKLNNTTIKEDKRIKTKREVFEAPKYSFVDEVDLENQIKEGKNKAYIKKYIKKLMEANKALTRDTTFKLLMCEVDEDYIRYKNEEKLTKSGKMKTVQKDVGYRASIKDMKKEFKELIKKNRNTRTLNKVNKYNIISIFDSFLTRALELENNELSEDLITIRIYHYAVFKQLLENGFTYKNEHYLSFTSSAGQIRNKKMVYIKESTWEKYHNTLTCGLSIEDINNSKECGCNINKFLSYLALTATSTDEWKDFKIDECIVLPDFETTIKGVEVDYIAKTRKKREVKILNEDGTYKKVEEEYWLLSDKAEQCEKDITITHSDGCGWILPELSKTNFQCRLPFIKGLLTPCNYISWCDKFNNSNYEVTDIYGTTWDLKKDNIKVVFFKSQFKMAKYYKDWNDYKDKFKKYSCKAGKCNEETGEFDNSNFTYQMWQTLEEVDDRVIKKYTEKISKSVKKAYYDKAEMLKFLGATKKNSNKNYLQQALLLYPQLLQDKYIKNELSEVINKKKKEAMSGKFKLNSTYTFLIPDIFSWMQFVFFGENGVSGLLKDGEVYCKLFDTKNCPELLVNRSPHLYKEHCVRKNITGKALNEWFISDGIYTSCHDVISKILQFDNDGDRANVIADYDIIQCAKSNMKIEDKDGKEVNIRPLYYEMGKAEPKEINAENIYQSLLKAFEYGNIGEYSNKLSKLWNYKGNDFVQEEKLNLAKIICCQNNFSIDAAKTLEMVEVSETIKEQLKKLEKLKLPYFFKYAKDKEANQVEIINESTVNRICKEIEKIPQLEYNFDSAGKFNKNMLMNNIKIDIDEKVVGKYEELNEEMQKYFMYVSNFSNIFDGDEEVSKERIASVVYDSLYLDFETFCADKNINIVDATDMVVKHIYKAHRDCKKSFLFNVLGGVIISNIKKNIKTKIKKPKKGYIFCSCCKKEVLKESNNQKMCRRCSEEKRKTKDRERKSKR